MNDAVTTGGIIKVSVRSSRIATPIREARPEKKEYPDEDSNKHERHANQYVQNNSSDQ